MSLWPTQKIDWKLNVCEMLLCAGEMNNVSTFERKFLNCQHLFNSLYIVCHFPKQLQLFDFTELIASQPPKKKVTGCLCILRIIDNAIAFSHTNCETTAQIRASLSLTLCSFLNIFVRPFFVPLLALSLVFRSNRLFSTSSFELLSHLLFLLYLL